MVNGKDGGWRKREITETEIKINTDDRTGTSPSRPNGAAAHTLNIHTHPHSL